MNDDPGAPIDMGFLSLPAKVVTEAEYFASASQIARLLVHVPAADLRTFAAELITAIYAGRSQDDLKLLVSQWHDTTLLFGDYELLRRLTAPISDLPHEPGD